MSRKLSILGRNTTDIIKFPLFPSPIPLAFLLSQRQPLRSIWWIFFHCTRYIQKVSSHVIWKIETFIEEDTRYKKYYTYHNDSSVPFKVGTLGIHTVHPVAISCPIIFSWISVMVWNLFPFKGDFSFGKSQKSRVPHLGCRQAWVIWVIDVSPKNSAWEVMHDQVHCHDGAASH